MIPQDVVKLPIAKHESDWRWQLKNMLRSEQDFASLINLTDREREAFQKTQGLFRTGATPYYAGLMDKSNPHCPIRRQTIPLPEECNTKSYEWNDPLGEEPRRAASSVVHKYPDRVLFLVVDRCAIYCRHCNRRRLVGGDAPPTRDEVEQGLEYIRRHGRIRDVLLSGGDPLLLSNKRLAYIIGELRKINHVEIIRIGTRLPVVCPMRIDEELCSILKENHPLYINTHFNHVKEITEETKRACNMLADAGVPLGNQTVLLRGINSSVQSLRALFRGLLAMRVKPYYLFQGDTVVGTDHLRTNVETAIDLMAGLRGYVTGMAMPHLAIDIPGGMGKVPIMKQYIVEQNEREVVLQNYRGVTVSYPQPELADATVPYDAVYFAGQPADDDSVPASDFGDAY